MPVVPASYTRKDPVIEVVKFEGTLADMRAIRDWVQTLLLPEWVVDFHENVRLMVISEPFGTYDGGEEVPPFPVYRYHNVYDRMYVAKNANNRFFALDEHVLISFFDPDVIPE